MFQVRSTGFLDDRMGRMSRGILDTWFVHCSSPSKIHSSQTADNVARKSAFNLVCSFTLRLVFNLVNQSTYNYFSILKIESDLFCLRSSFFLGSCASKQL